MSSGTARLTEMTLPERSWLCIASMARSMSSSLPNITKPKPLGFLVYRSSITSALVGWNSANAAGRGHGQHGHGVTARQGWPCKGGCRPLHTPGPWLAWPRKAPATHTPATSAHHSSVYHRPCPMEFLRRRLCTSGRKGAGKPPPRPAALHRRDDSAAWHGPRSPRCSWCQMPQLKIVLVQLYGAGMKSGGLSWPARSIGTSAERADCARCRDCKEIPLADMRRSLCSGHAFTPVLGQQVLRHAWLT